MKFKKSMLILILAIFFVSIAGVCAADANDTAIASEDANQIEVSSNDVIVEDNLKTSEGNTTLTQANDDEIVSAESGSQILAEGEGTYYDLRNEIGNGGDKSLTKSYYSYTGGDPIEITTSGVINGNGAVIDMAGSTIRAFIVSASGVTINNMTIKNVNYEGYNDGGAIYFSVPGTVENCTFIGNNAYCGGALSGGDAHNSIFISNVARIYGGAINNGNAYNCYFADNKAIYGGAIKDGTAINCNFTGNYAGSGAGAIYHGSAVLCIFKTSSDTLYRTNIATFSVSKSYLRFDSGDRLLFNITCDNKNYDGYNTTITLTQDGNQVGVYYALSGSDEGWHMELSPGAYSATLSMEPYTINPITVAITVGIEASTYSELSTEIASGENYIELQHDYYVYDYGSTIELKNPNTVIDGKGAVIDMLGLNIQAFTVNASNVTIKDLTIKNANFDGDGGAIYNMGTLTISNANLTNNKARYGGAIYNMGTLTISNANLTNNKANEGGAIYNMGTLTITGTNLTNNKANEGGAIYNMGTLTITGTNLTNNKASNGGAIYSCLRKSTFITTIKNNIFKDNVAENYGGAVYNYLLRIEGTTTIKDNTFTGNTAEDGTAIYTYYNDVDLQSIDLESNDFNGNNYTFNTWDRTSITVVGNTFDYIQDAIDLVKDGGTVYLDEKTYFGSGTVINIDKSINLIGKNTILDAQRLSGMLNITENVYSITLQNINFLNGYKFGKMVNGAIEFLGYNLNIINCTFMNYTSTGNYLFDGFFMIYACNRNANVSILDSRFLNNVFIGRNGDTYFNVNNLVVDNCNFTNNSCIPTDTAGSIHPTCIRSDSNNNIITNCIFEKNYEDGNFGIINLYSPNNTIINCTFSNNFGDGGVSTTIYPSSIIAIRNVGNNYTNHNYEFNPKIFCCNSSTLISNCKFINNTHDNHILFYMDRIHIGGGEYNVNFSDMSHSAIIENCDFENEKDVTFIETRWLNNLTVKDCNFDNIASDTVIKFSREDVITDRSGCNDTVNIFNSNFTNISERAIYVHDNWYDYRITVNVVDCNFIDIGGEAIYHYQTEETKASLTVRNCNFINGHNHAIYGVANRNMIIDNCNFTNNSNNAIFEEVDYNNQITPDNISINNCNFFNNHAEYGGAIHIEGDNTCITNCRFENNYAGWHGGAIYMYKASDRLPDLNNTSIIDCTFNNNTAGHLGGAVYIMSHNSTISNCNFTNHHLVGNLKYCAIMCFDGNNSVLSDCNFINSSADYDAIGRFRGDNITIRNCNFSNSYNARGYAFYIGFKNGEGGVHISDCNFINCSTGQGGEVGVLYLEQGNAIIENCNFTNGNVYTWGSAIFIALYGRVDFLPVGNITINNCVFTDNHVKLGVWDYYLGGTIMVECLYNSTISNCIFIGNTADETDMGGGAILLHGEGSNNRIINCTFEGNSAANLGGGAILLQAMHNTTIINSTFKSNKASSRSLTAENGDDIITFTFEGYECYIHAVEVDDLSDVHFYNVTYWDGEMLNTDDAAPRKSYLQSNQEIIVEAYDSEMTLAVTFTAMTDSNGQVVYNYITLPVGTYTYVAYHPDNDYYTYINTTGTFTVDNSFTALYEKICRPADSTTLGIDYIFDFQSDALLADGMVIDKNITIYGNGHSIDASNIARIFNVTDSGSLTLVNVTLKNAKGDDGAAIYNNGTVSLISSAVTNANSTAKGAIYNLNTLEIINSTIADNHAVHGTVYNDGGEVTISGSNITCNYAEIGGGVYNNNGNVTVSDSRFCENYANNGSAIWTTNGENVHLTDVRMVDNEGDALYSDDGVPIDTSGVKFLTAVFFVIDDIYDFIKGSEITIRVNELRKGNEFSGNVTVFIGDENYTVELTNGCGSRAVTPNLDIGTYTVRLIFNETDVYESASAETGPFNIMTSPQIRIANITSVDEGTAVLIKVTALESFNFDLTVQIAGENYNVSMTNGSGERTITLSPGTYKATISFTGSDYYTSCDAESNQFIVRKNPRISIADIANVIQGTPISIKVSAVGSFNGELVITINGANYTVSMTNGSGVRTVTLAPGSYNATISFTGNDYYTASSAQSNGFTVSKETTSITASALTVVYNANKQLVITLKDSKGKPISGQTITVNLNGVKTLKTDKNGQVKVPTKGLAAKVYTAKITFKGNANYIASSKNVKVTVKKATPKLTAKSKKFKKSVKVKKYTVTLKDNTGKAMKKVQLTIKIGKKTYKAKTNNKGKATFKIKKLTKKGRYTAVIKYKGNKNYNKITKKVKITVK